MLTSVPNSALSRALALAALRRLSHGRLEVIEGQRRVVFGPADAELQAQVRVVDAGVWRSLARGTVGIAERWVDDAWDCNDLVSLGRMFSRELRQFDRVRRLLVPAQRAARLIPENTALASGLMPCSLGVRRRCKQSAKRASQASRSASPVT